MKTRSNAAGSDGGLVRTATSRTVSESLSSGSRSVDETVSNGGGDLAAREIPSLRPELRVRGRDKVVGLIALSKCRFVCNRLFYVVYDRCQCVT